ncbi:MAG: carbohydrate ABC transporter permease [Actinomycetota bacterium]
MNAQTLLPSGRNTAKRRARRKTDPKEIVSYFFMAVLSLIFLLPILYMFMGSFKPADDVLGGFSGFLPTNLSFDNYGKIYERLNSPETGYFWQFYLTSIIVTTAIVVGGLVVNSLAAYALARLRWRGRAIALTVVILLVILPFEAIAVPLFYMLNDYRNTYWVQFMPFIANAFSIYLFYSFFANLPKDFEEAARIDGASVFGTFWRIIVPISGPVYASVTILTFLSAWASFLWPVLMVSDAKYRPLPLEISVFWAQPPIDWGAIFAFGVLMVLPVLIVFLIFQRWFVQSVASSGIKG